MRDSLGGFLALADAGRLADGMRTETGDGLGRLRTILEDPIDALDRVENTAGLVPRQTPGHLTLSVSDSVRDRTS